MIPYGWLGAAVLGVYWLNALLVAAASLQDLGDVRAARARWRRALRGVVERGHGPDGALAEHRIEQVGRALDADVPSIGFWDRSYAGEVFGGAVRTEAGAIVELAAQASADVWTAESERAARAALSGDAQLDAAYADARRGRGFARTVTTRIAAGQTVWVAGEASGGQVEKPAVSAVDPAAWCAVATRRILTFTATQLAVGGALTAVAVWPPAFGLVSTLGGAAMFVFFLAVLLPGGVVTREKVRLPPVAPLRGEWRRSTPKSEPVAARADS